MKTQTPRSHEQIKTGIKKARHVIEAGDEAVAAYLLDVPVEDIQCVSRNVP